MISLDKYLAYGQTIIPNLVLNQYHQLGLTSEEFIFWQQLYAKKQLGDDFPDLAPIAKNMGLPQQQVYQLLNSLVAKQILSIETKIDERGQSSDHYDFSLIFQKLEHLSQQAAKAQAENDDALKVRQLYQSFQEEFGRTLSPTEFERISQWMEQDHYSPDLILLALKEAVLNQAMSLRYIETILDKWQKSNVRTAQEAEAQIERRRRLKRQREAEQTAPSQSSKPKPKITLHNWLEGE